jgi:hypothetical protein
MEVAGNACEAAARTVEVCREQLAVVLSGVGCQNSVRDPRNLRLT